MRGAFPASPASSRIAGLANYYRPVVIDSKAIRNASIRHTGIQVQPAWDAPLQGVPDTFTCTFEKSADNSHWTTYAVDGPFPPGVFTSGGWGGRTYGDSAGDGTQYWRVSLFATYAGVSGPTTVLAIDIFA